MTRLPGPLYGLAMRKVWKSTCIQQAFNKQDPLGKRKSQWGTSYTNPGFVSGVCPLRENVISFFFLKIFAQTTQHVGS